MKLKTLKYRIGNLIYNTLQVPRTTKKRSFHIKKSANGKEYKVYDKKTANNNPYYLAHLYKKDGTLRTRKVRSLKEFEQFYCNSNSNLLDNAQDQLLATIKASDNHNESEPRNSQDDSDSEDDSQPKREDDFK